MPSTANRLVVLVALITLSIAIGYMLGRSRSGAIPTQVDVAGHEANGDSALPGEQVAPAATASREIAAPVSLFEQINAIRANGRPEAQPYLLKKLFETMTAEEAPALLAQLLDEQPWPGRPVLLQLLFERWGEVASEAALNAAKALPLRERAPSLAAALGGLAAHDPDRAWQLMVEAADGWPALTVHVGTVFDQLARRDLSDAINRRSEITGARARQNVQHVIIRYANESGRTDELLAAVQTFDSVEDRKSWFNEAFMYWATTDPEASLNALEAIDDPVLAGSAVGGFLTGWSRNDPIGAASYVLDNRSDPAVAKHMTTVLGGAFSNGSTSQTTVLVKRLIADGAFDDLGSRSILPLVFRHPELAMQAASSLSDERERTQSVGNTIGNWASRDPDAAMAHYEKLQDPEVRQRARHPLAFAFMRREDGGSHLLRLIDELPAGRPRAGFVENLLSLAVTPNFQSSSSSVQALQGIIRDLPDLSETGRRNAEKLFGADALPAANPSTP